MTTTPVGDDPLTPERLYSLVTDEVLLDGFVNSDEARLLRRLAEFLKLPETVSDRILQTSRRRFSENELGDSRTLDRCKLYEQVLECVLADSVIDPEEEDLVRGVARLLAISDRDHYRIWTRVKQNLAGSNAS